MDNGSVSITPQDVRDLRMRGMLLERIPAFSFLRLGAIDNVCTFVIINPMEFARTHLMLSTLLALTAFQSEQ